MSSRSSRKTNLNYNHLHYFHVAAVEGSVGGAAQILGVTQPTISEQLQTLERTLGVALFERTSSGLKLTDAGRLAFKHTSVMFGAGERLAAALDYETRPAPCRVRIGVSNDLARITTRTLLSVFLGDPCMPTIQIGDYLELARDLRANRLDLLLCDAEPQKSERRGLEVKVIERTQLVVVAPPSLVPSADWQEVFFLHYRTGSRLRWDVDAFLSERALKPQIVAEVDDALFLLDAVERDNHIAIVPRILVRDAIAAGRLRELHAFPSAHVGMYAMYQSTAEPGVRAVQRLLAHVAGS